MAHSGTEAEEHNGRDRHVLFKVSIFFYSMPPMNSGLNETRSENQNSEHSGIFVIVLECCEIPNFTGF